ncbi:MAG: hypothetical protein RLZZ584_1689 [Pseudomonadota bacterium]|jgi:hypothetical protein
MPPISHLNTLPRVLATLGLTAALGGCASMSGGGWINLVDGEKGLANFTQTGEADWAARDGAIQATQGGKTPSYLVSRQSYTDFEMRVEFWASDDANSGVFMRCKDPSNPGDESCYEANIFDQRPDPSYATGAIVKVAKVAQPFARAGGKWNTFDLKVQGKRLVVVMNGATTVDVQDDKLASGPFALQWGRGTIKFRKVEIRPL